jgi:hypothetical protein
VDGSLGLCALPLDHTPANKKARTWRAFALMRRNQAGGSASGAFEGKRLDIAPLYADVPEVSVGEPHQLVIGVSVCTPSAVSLGKTIGHGQRLSGLAETSFSVRD